MSLNSRGRSTRQSAIRMVICWGLLFSPPATAFKIGLIYPQKSSSSWAVESFTQFRLAVKRINENKHHQASGSFPILEFVAYDSQGGSLTALKGAAHLIETDHCNVLIGPAYSAEIPAASAFASVRLPKQTTAPVVWSLVRRRYRPPSARGIGSRAIVCGAVLAGEKRPHHQSGRDIR